VDERAALLRAIIDEPDEDAHRLVFADWLDEHDEADQAEFVRLQVRLHAMRPWQDGYDDLKRRERALLQRHADAWLGPVRPWLLRKFQPRDLDDHAIFRRGLVETALVEPERFLVDPDGLFDAAPITGAVFWIPPAVLSRVLDWPALARLRRLRFLSSDSRVCAPADRNIRLSAGDYRRIAGCPRLEGLRELELTSQRIGADEVAALVGSPRLGNVETLNLAHSCLDGDGFDAIGSGMALPALRHLHVNNNYDSGRLGSWRSRPWLRRLRTLDLGYCGLSADETADVLASSHWPELESLSLAMLTEPCTLDALACAFEGMPRLARLDLEHRRFANLPRALEGVRFAALESLDLRSAFAGLRADSFLTSEAFPALRVLDLSNNKLEDGLPALGRSEVAAGLRRLNVRNCGASLDDLLEFARTARLPELKYLCLGEQDRPFTPRALRTLGESEGFPRLTTLDLCLPGSEKLYQALAAMPLLRRVAHLRLYGGTVTDKCVAILTGSPGFQGLASLEFWGSSINPANERRLKDHFGERYLE
jgi:uncharacterized protein (TIGR02996 family)